MQIVYLTGEIILLGTVDEAHDVKESYADGGPYAYASPDSSETIQNPMVVYDTVRISLYTCRICCTLMVLQPESCAEDIYVVPASNEEALYVQLSDIRVSEVLRTSLRYNICNGRELVQCHSFASKMADNNPLNFVE